MPELKHLADALARRHNRTVNGWCFYSKRQLKKKGAFLNLLFSRIFILIGFTLIPLGTLSIAIAEAKIYTFSSWRTLIMAGALSIIFGIVLRYFVVFRKKCFYCAETIKSSARICKHCKKDLTNAA